MPDNEEANTISQATGTDPAVKNLMDIFMSEHTQFLKCMRNFSANHTGDQVVKETMNSLNKTSGSTTDLTGTKFASSS